MTTKTKTKYDIQAEEFLAKFNITLEVRRAAFPECPRWDMGKCAKGRHTHGEKFNGQFSRGTEGKPVHGTAPLGFDFWGSLNDAEKGKRPSHYTVLACVSSDISCSTDPDEVHAEFGDMKPSQAQAIADHARKLQSFFTGAERAALAEIQ